MRLILQLRRWLFRQELGEMDLRLRKTEYRLSLLHRLLTTMEEPTLERAISSELCNVVQMRQEVVELYREADRWEST